MKKTRYTLLIALGLIFICAPSQDIHAQGKGSYRLSGGSGFFIAGYSFLDLKGMNNRFRPYGIQEMEEGSVSFGGGGQFMLNNWVIGGEGHGLSGGTSENQEYRTTHSGGYGLFDLGYVVYSTPLMLIYPVLGIGGGGMVVSVTDRSKTPVDFDDLIKSPGREAYIGTGGFLLQASLSADFYVLGSRGEGGTGGFLVGLRAGYLWQPGSSWYFNKDELSGAPEAGLSGPFIRLALGGGGHGRSQKQNQNK